MAYQFFHIETYSDAPKRVRGTADHYNSAEQVEGEAAREARYSQHVAEPQPPLSMNFDGLVPLQQLIARRRQLVSSITETLTSATGKIYTRKLRNDAATLYTEIHSHPMTSAEYLADRKANHPEVLRWARLAVKDFQRRMPEGVEAAAVMHLDEGHVHMHILAINAGDPRLDANKLHAGKVAATAYRENNVSEALVSLPKPDLHPLPLKPKKLRPSKNRETQKKRDASHKAALAQWSIDRMRIEARNKVLLRDWEAANNAHLQAGRKARGKTHVQRAFNDALSKLQDDYYEAVGKPCGLLRDGPRRERLSTKEYAKRKRTARKIADELDKMEAASREITLTTAEIAKQQEKLKAWQRDLNAGEDNLSTLAARLQAIGQELAAKSAALEKAEAAQHEKSMRQLQQLSAKEAKLADVQRDLAAKIEAITIREADLASIEKN
ncbi:hypothetical protein BVG79_02163 [Ketogulonicigenium robustum]|uniref:Mob protein n=1 Tax=Ketogulonicigenium robustum TaxID=92947 RepID=A0A1W6P255_9RHOB|nr:hypothetical protein [Ketogulonicigenium robustum]ARO15503.1 hypothetical protein BVG79_02163 [Ketogulonicigenium robustum]